MSEALRKSMAWPHTWAGVVLGSVLFAIFWMGSLSVFDQEIDRWMQPGTRLPALERPVSFDRDVLPVAAAQAPHSAAWLFSLPTDRAPQVRFFYREAMGFTLRSIDPGTGTLIPDQGSYAGTSFLYPFHYRLHIRWMDLGYWIVGLAAMGMLVLLISGVILHRKLFVDFFLFRPKKQLQRASLDLHNLTGVLVLPFHFVITLSGLVIFMGIYFPKAGWVPYGNGPTAREQFNQEAYGGFKRPKAGVPGTLASVDAMVAEAERRWPGGRASGVRVWHPGDANAYVEVRRSIEQDITMHLDRVVFDGTTGAVLDRFTATPVMQVQRTISGLHLVQFSHWALRWLYFLAGLSGCVLIATGFLFWLESRRASHVKKGLAGVRVVEALTIGSVSGIVLATLAFFVVNRLLPLGAEFAGQDRAALEVWTFYLVWLGTFVHAALRPARPATQPARRAWREQCGAIAVLALAAVLLNLGTTDAWRAWAQGQRAVAGMDGVLLLGAGLAVVAWRRLGAPQPLRRPARTDRAPPRETPAHGT